jgi:hypothetical protein
MAGFDQPFDQPGDVAHSKPSSASRRRTTSCHQAPLSSWAIRSKRGRVTSNRSRRPAAHLALDQGGAGQEAQPQPELVAVIFREFDRLGLGIEDHDAITCLGLAGSTETAICIGRLYLRPSNNSPVAASQNAGARRAFSHFFRLQTIGAPLACRAVTVGAPCGLLAAARSPSE